ncbi:MAG: phage major capsid protein [Thermodesulfobacteriota bacterium]|nr:phage major capsid protein [Thermodesulfobacteriota bacterium]
MTSWEQSRYDELERRYDELSRESIRKPPREEPWTEDDDPPRQSRAKDGVLYFLPQTLTARGLGLTGVNETIRKPESRFFDNYLQRGLVGLREHEREYFQTRALQLDKDDSGGFLVAPQEFMKRVILKLDDLVHIRRYATKLVLESAHNLGAPMLDSDPEDPEWTSELQIGGDADDEMSFEKRDLSPHPVAKHIRVSKTLIRRSALAEPLVRGRLTHKMGIVQENAFLNGTGVNQPLGLLVASDFGITTSRDTTTTAVGGIKADDVIDCKYALKGQYRKHCRWIVSRDFVKRCRKLKDGEGNYLWRPGLSADRPDTLLDLPFDESEYFDDWATGTYQAILGDYEFYWICDALDVEVQVLTELFAASNQNGYVIRSETDGMPVVEEAFQRVAIG